MNKEVIHKQLKDENIENHRTRKANAKFSERAIRPFMDTLYRRVETDEKEGKQNIEWLDYILQI